MDIFYKKIFSLGVKNNLSNEIIVESISDFDSEFTTSLSSGKFKIFNEKNDNVQNLSDCSSCSEKLTDNNSDFSVNSENTSENLENSNTKIKKNYPSDKMSIESAIEKKYLNSDLLKQKYYEEFNSINQENEKEELGSISISVLKNDFSQVINTITIGNTLYVLNSQKLTPKICSKFSLHSSCVKSTCFKSGIYYSLWNNSLGIKTIYNLLIQLLINFPKFRNKCKCCYNAKTKLIFDKLEEEYIKKTFNYLDSKDLEYKINFLINKFMSVIGLNSCECKYIGKYFDFYNKDYLNFSVLYKTYKKTIFNLIPMILKYFSIEKDFVRSTYLIKKSRCIHEDIRYNNFTYCLKNKYPDVNSEQIDNLVKDIYLVNEWLISSYKITLLLFNQQSLETFNHVLNFSVNGKLINKLFNKIYSKDNNLLNLNYTVNKVNLVNLIFETTKKSEISNEIIVSLINQIIVQLYYKNKKIPNVQKKINELMIQYIVECINYNKIELGIEFISNIKNLNIEYVSSDYTLDLTTNSIISLFPTPIKKTITFVELVNYIFDKIISGDISPDIKYSYLKIINKNKINIINYDFITKLIEISDGEIISCKFDYNFDYYFIANSPNNKSEYLESTIKKCIQNKKPQILKFILSANDYLKINIKINPYIIYFSILEQMIEFNEKDYLPLLEVIANYNYDINEKTTEGLNLLYIGIKKSFTYSSLQLIKNLSDTNFHVENNKNLLFCCVDYLNWRIFSLIIKHNPNLVNENYSELNIHTYLFNKIHNETLLMRFLIVLLSEEKYNSNDSNRQNINIGFQILNSKLSKQNKILAFLILTKKSNSINPTIMHNNIPLILHCVILEEYEITCLLLNNMLKDNKIKKIENVKTLYLDYEYVDQSINVNFIPIILKYVKEYVGTKIIINEPVLEVDIYMENILVIGLEILVAILYYQIPRDKFNILDLQNNNSNKLDNYLSDKQNTKELNNCYMEISYNEDSYNMTNNKKNIWLNTNKKPINYLENSSSLSSSSESSEKIEETEISFG